MSRRRPARPRTNPLPRVDIIEDWAGEAYVVRPLTGAASTKPYRCPGCEQEIRPATPHIVVWPADHPSGTDVRRHWHTPCWRARDRRRPR